MSEIKWHPVSKEPADKGLNMFDVFYLCNGDGTVDVIYRVMDEWRRNGRISGFEKMYEDWHHATRHWTHWTDHIPGPEE